MLQQDVGIALPSARYFVGDQNDIDEISGQNKAGNPTHIIDLNCYGAFALIKHRSERGTLARSGDL